MAKNTARKNDLQVVHTIARVLNFNDADIASAYVGTLPKGAVITGTDVYVTTAFNAVTSNNVSAGSQVTLNEVLTSAQAAAGSTGVKQNFAPNASPYLIDLAADTDIYATYNSTGSAATAGRCVIVTRFVPHTTT
jgi:hypothetical protein